MANQQKTKDVLEDVGGAMSKLAKHRPAKSKEEALAREAEVMKRVRAEQAEKRNRG